MSIDVPCQNYKKPDRFININLKTKIDIISNDGYETIEINKVKHNKMMEELVSFYYPLQIKINNIIFRYFKEGEEKSGGFGKVITYKSNETKQLVAAKIGHIDCDIKYNKILIDNNICLDRMTIGKDIRSKNNHIFFMNYAEYDLSEVMYKLNLQEKLKIVKDIIDTLKCLYDKGYYFIDLKLNNILFYCKNNNQFKIMFGDIGGIITLDDTNNFTSTYKNTCNTYIKKYFYEKDPKKYILYIMNISFVITILYLLCPDTDKQNYIKDVLSQIHLDIVKFDNNSKVYEWDTATWVLSEGETPESEMDKNIKNFEQKFQDLNNVFIEFYDKSKLENLLNNLKEIILLKKNFYDVSILENIDLIMNKSYVDYNKYENVLYIMEHLSSI